MNNLLNCNFGVISLQLCDTALASFPFWSCNILVDAYAMFGQSNYVSSIGIPCLTKTMKYQL